MLSPPIEIEGFKMIDVSRESILSAKFRRATNISGDKKYFSQSYSIVQLIQTIE